MARCWDGIIPFRYACRIGSPASVGQAPDHDQHHDDPEVVDQPDEREQRDAEAAREQQGGGTPPEQRADHRGEQTADDLGAGDDRGHQAGDPVRLRVAPQVEQVGLQRVEDVDADAAAEDPGQHGGADRRHLEPVVAPSC